MSNKSTGSRAMKMVPRSTTLADCEREARENGLPGAAAKLAVAHNYGFSTWRQLEVYVAHPAGLSNFLQLACLQYFPTDSPANWERAQAMLSADPALAQRDIWSAACVGDAAMVGGLLDAEPDLVNRRGGYHDWEPLLYACYSRLDLPEGSTLSVARLLLERGADPNAHYMWNGQYRFTALTGAFGEGEMGPVNQPEHEYGATLARLLLEAGADPNDGQALYNRMFTQGSAHLELLLEYDLNAEHRANWLVARDGELVPHPDRTLTYQLQWAVRKHHVERAKLLIDHGADVTVGTGDGRTLYEAAAVTGHRDLAQYLADHGAQVKELGAADRFAAACNGADVPTARELVAQCPELLPGLPNAGADLLADAASANRLDAARVMIAVGCRLNPPGVTPLHQAAFHGHVAMAELLVANGADPSARDDKYAGTPMQWAIAMGQSGMRDYLANCGIGVFDAVLCQNTDRIAALLDVNPSLISATIAGERRTETPHPSDWQTPLGVAVVWNRPEAARLLLRRGADVNIVDGEGRRLVDVARAEGGPELVGMIEAHAAHSGAG